MYEEVASSSRTNDGSSSRLVLCRSSKLFIELVISLGSLGKDSNWIRWCSYSYRRFNKRYGKHTFLPLPFE